MSRDKQISEIANDLRALDCLQHNPNYSIEYQRATGLYSLGYRKSTDLAEEIFAEIEEMLNMQAKIVCKTRETAKEADEPMISWIAMLDGRIYSLRVVEEHLAELKKKYTEEGK